MADGEKLRNVFKEALDKKGILDEIRSRLRAELFHMIDDCHGARPGSSRGNLLINELIREYLSFNNYKHTASVLESEASLPDESLDREFMIQELNFKKEQVRPELPLLYSILPHHASHRERNGIKYACVRSHLAKDLHRIKRCQTSLVTYNEEPVKKLFLKTRPSRDIGARCNMFQNAFLPTAEAGSSVHDEVYLSMRRFLKTLRLFGIFPVTETVGSSGTGSVVDGLEFKFLSRHLPLSIAALICTIVFTFNIISYHIILIENPVERMMMNMAASVLFLGASGHIVSATLLARHWPVYFKKWQIVDRMLDIRSDKKLARFTDVALLVFVSYMASSMAMSLYSIVLNFIYDYDASTSYPVGFAIGVLAYTVYVPACQILPEILFSCLCRAIHIRIRRLAEKLQELLLDVQPTLEVAGELETLRLAYQRIMEIVRYTNRIMDVALLLTCLVNATSLSIIVYLVVRQTVDNFGVKGLKLLLAMANLIRLVPVCLSADNVKVEVKKLNRVVFKAPVSQLSPSCQEEMRLFVRFVSHSPENPFTALGLIHVNRGYINSVAGTIVTYTLALFQFDEQGTEIPGEVCENTAGNPGMLLKNDTVHF